MSKRWRSGYPITRHPRRQAHIAERTQTILSDPDSPDVPRLKAEIDQLVYGLYELTEEEIKVVERKK